MDDFIEIIGDEVISAIAQEYDRTEESLRDDVATLKQWMKNQPHLPEVLDDKYLQNFLIMNKCSIERTKSKIDMYYTLRCKIPDMFPNPKLPQMQQLLKIASTVLVPKLTQNLYRLMIFKVFDLELVDLLHPQNVLTQIVNLQELRLAEDVMHGDIFIFDFNGLTMSYMMKYSPSLVVKIGAIFKEIYALKLKEMYFVNSPPFVNSLLSLIKTVVKPKIFDRIFTCADTSILVQKIPKECLPEDYGGCEKSMEELRCALQKKFSQYQNRFDLLDGLKVDEDLRPEGLRNDDVLGFHGNFKKLNVD